MVSHINGIFNHNHIALINKKLSTILCKRVDNITIHTFAYGGVSLALLLVNVYAPKLLTPNSSFLTKNSSRFREEFLIISQRY